MYFTNCSGIVSFIVSIIRTIKCVKLSVLSDNGVIQRESTKIPYLCKTFICEPTNQVIQITCATNITDPVTIIDIEYITICSIMAYSITIYVCERWIFIFVRSQRDLILL